MNLYLDKFAEGVKLALSEHEKGHNIFEMKGGSIIPTIDSQRLWQFSRTPDAIHLSDNGQTYSFKGMLDPDKETALEKLPDVPLPDMYNHSVSKGKAQVHRGNPGSLYFTLQEGKSNPTYTFRHSSENRWVAIPKSRKAKKQLAEEPFVENVNLEHVKEGMAQEIQNYFTETAGESQGFFKKALVGEALLGLLNAPSQLALAPGRLVGGPETYFGDQSPTAGENASTGLLNAGMAGLAGAGLGGAYHLAKRHLYNSDAENAIEDQDPNTLTRRMAIPAAGMAGLNFAGRSMFPGAINNHDWRMFS